jgi:DNA-binding response OmpR family regulator
MVKVLYIDDEPALLDVGKIFLEKMGGVSVDTSNSAYEGLKKIASNRYDAVVTDYEMPGMDGIELLKQLRSQGNDIPLIIFTGRGRESVAIEALNNGADFYLQKTGDIDAQYRELKNMIMQVVRRRNSERMQAETESLYRLLFNKMNQGYAFHEVICDDTGEPSDYRFIEVNPEYERLMQISREECIGKTITEIMPGIDPSWISRLGNVAMTQVPVIFEETNLVSGKYFEISAFSPIAKKFAIVMEDITERKVHGNALESAYRKLNLLSNITRHDINNQLTVLIGYLELSKNLATTPDLENYLSTATRSAETIARQITFSKDYQNMGVLAPAWQNINNIVNKASVFLKNDTVVPEIQWNDIEIFADPLFERVFYNLIDNSHRHGSDLTKIRFGIHEADNALNIVYEDDGGGIPPADKSRIFEHGFGRNTGYGMFLTREILSITGMTIVENGKYGQGARFEITVPSSNYRHRSNEQEMHSPSVVPHTVQEFPLSDS